MARKTKQTKPGSEKPFKHDLNVKFGTVSITGDRTNVGLTIYGGPDLLQTIHGLFTSAQLEVDLRCDPNADEDADGQGTLHGDDALSVTGAPTVNSYSGYNDHFHTTLSFPGDAGAFEGLGRFAKHHGKLLCTRLGDAKTKPDADGDQHNGD